MSKKHQYETATDYSFIINDKVIEPLNHKQKVGVVWNFITLMDFKDEVVFDRGMGGKSYVFEIIDEEVKWWVRNTNTKKTTSMTF